MNAHDELALRGVAFLLFLLAALGLSVMAVEVRRFADQSERIGVQARAFNDAVEHYGR